MSKSYSNHSSISCSNMIIKSDNSIDNQIKSSQIEESKYISKPKYMNLKSLFEESDDDKSTSSQSKKIEKSFEIKAKSEDMKALLEKVEISKGEMFMNDIHLKPSIYKGISKNKLNISDLIEDYIYDNLDIYYRKKKGQYVISYYREYIKKSIKPVIIIIGDYGCGKEFLFNGPNVVNNLTIEEVIDCKFQNEINLYPDAIQDYFSNYYISDYEKTLLMKIWNNIKNRISIPKEIFFYECPRDEIPHIHKQLSKNLKELESKIEIITFPLLSESYFKTIIEDIMIHLRLDFKKNSYLKTINDVVSVCKNGLIMKFISISNIIYDYIPLTQKLGLSQASEIQASKKSLGSNQSNLTINTNRTYNINEKNNFIDYLDFDQGTITALNNVNDSNINIKKSINSKISDRSIYSLLGRVLYNKRLNLKNGQIEGKLKSENYNDKNYIMYFDIENIIDIYPDVPYLFLKHVYINMINHIVCIDEISNILEEFSYNDSIYHDYSYCDQTLHSLTAYCLLNKSQYSNDGKTNKKLINFNSQVYTSLNKLQEKRKKELSHLNSMLRTLNFLMELSDLKNDFSKYMFDIYLKSNIYLESKVVEDMRKQNKINNDFVMLKIGNIQKDKK